MDYSKLEAELELQKISNYFKAKDYINVEDNTKKLIKRFPNHLPIYNLLGLSLHYQGKYLEAIKNFKLVINKNPKFFSAINNLGITYWAMGDLMNAQLAFEDAIKINPKFVLALSNLGNIKKDLNNFKESIKIYNQALEIDKNNYTVLNNLGFVLQSIGRFEKAKQCFETSIKTNPKNTRSHRLLSMSLKYDINNIHLKNMENLIKDQSLSDSQKIELYFALGKAYEDIKNHNKAYESYNLGNILKRKIIKYSINDDIKLFDNIKKLFSNIDFKNLHDFGFDSEKMIFILGMPRSGTTLVEQIISGHKNVFGAGELRILVNLVKENFFSEGKVKFAKKLSPEDKKFFYHIGEKYINSTKIYNSNQRHITDKDPLNFRWIGIIKLILPKSKIIHCMRDPKDTCWSLFKNFFTGQISFAFTQEELGKYYNLYRNLMKFWKQLIPSFIYDISYEKLIENQELETRKLLNFCNLNWDENCLKFFENKSPIRTLSISQARTPIYKTSIKSWKRYENDLVTLFKTLDQN